MPDIRTTSDLVPAARMEGTSLVVAINGEIDLHNSPNLRTELLDLLNKQNPKKLILNVAKVPYMDSSAIAVLVEALQKMHKTGGKVCLANPQPRVRSLLDIARLAGLFTICSDEAEALAK